MTSSLKHKVLFEIKRGYRLHGFAPSIREICTAVDCSSTSAVNYCINKLIDEGYLTVGEKRTASTVVPTQKEIE